MNDDVDNDSLMEENPVGEVARWLPRLVVAGTIAGFMALAWYAYRTGTQSLKDEDLMVVEADKTPVKEKPDDPGGMKFPNQDKTIFDTFANNAQTPPKVERLLPSPEEPKLQQLDTSETKTWINDKLQKKEEVIAAPAKPEAVIAPVEPVVQSPAPAKELAPVAKEVTPATKPSPVEEKKIDTHDVESYTAPAKEVKATPKVETKPVAKKEESKPKAAASNGTAKVQLGAYRSESEARAAFSKMQKKYSALAEKTPIIVKADLGVKGIYYRLRVGGVADAKAFCSKLAGQACIPVQ